MENNAKITFQFLSEPSDVNFGGKVHGGVVMKWIDQTAYTCARNWAENYCVTIYVGGIRFYKPITIGEQIKIEASVLYTGTSSIHIGVDVYSKKFEEEIFAKKTHCVIVFVSVDVHGNPQKVKPWQPKTEHELQMQQYALKLKQLREQIDEEMKPYITL
jgi:acyl-CoA hydrolase